LNNLATTAHAKGDYDTALHYLEESLVIRQQIGDIRGMATTMHNMGATLFQDKNQPEAAIPYLLQAYQIRHQIGVPQVKSTESWLCSIIEKIGEARFNQLLAEYQQQSS
jgi:tetratricopeptide (TPR) repeat protein